MQFAIVSLVFLVVLILVFAALFALVAQKGRRKDELRDVGVEMLRYRVPDGRDPAVVLAALQREGFEAIPDAQGDPGSLDVLIPCLDGKDRHREHIRTVIENTERLSFSADEGVPVGKVEFADE